MLLVKSVQILVFGFAMFPIAMGALATGILFASYNLAVARNPEEAEGLYNTTLAGFAFVESFIFIALFVAVLVTAVL